MAETTKVLGTIPVNREAYSPSKNYYKDNIVMHNNCAYYCKVKGPISNIEPGTESINWGLWSGVPLESQNVDLAVNKGVTPKLLQKSSAVWRLISGGTSISYSINGNTLTINFTGNIELANYDVITVYRGGSHTFTLSSTSFLVFNPQSEEKLLVKPSLGEDDYLMLYWNSNSRQFSGPLSEALLESATNNNRVRISVLEPAVEKLKADTAGLKLPTDLFGKSSSVPASQKLATYGAATWRIISGGSNISYNISGRVLKITIVGNIEFGYNNVVVLSIRNLNTTWVLDRTVSLVYDTLTNEAVVKDNIEQTDIFMLHWNASSYCFSGPLSETLLQFSKVQQSDVVNQQSNANTYCHMWGYKAYIKFDYKTRTLTYKMNWGICINGKFVTFMEYDEGEKQIVLPAINGTVWYNLATRGIDVEGDRTYAGTEKLLLFRYNEGSRIITGLWEPLISQNYSKIDRDNIAELQTAKANIEDRLSGVEQSVGVSKGFYYTGKSVMNAASYKEILRATGGNSYAQGFAGNEDYSIVFENGGFIHIYNSKTWEKLAAYQSPLNTHCDSAFMGDEKYSEESIMPVVYVTLDGNAGKIVVLDIRLDSSTIVQTITVNHNIPVTGYYGTSNISADLVNRRLFCCGCKLARYQQHAGNFYMFTPYRLPSLEEGEEVTVDAVGDTFSIPYYPLTDSTQDNDYANAQSIAYYQGYIYLSVGRSTATSHFVHVVDYDNKEFINTLFMGRDAYRTEPEGSAFINGKFYALHVNNVLVEYTFN